MWIFFKWLILNVSRFFYPDFIKSLALENDLLRNFTCCVNIVLKSLFFKQKTFTVIPPNLSFFGLRFFGIANLDPANLSVSFSSKMLI